MTPDLAGRDDCDASGDALYFGPRSLYRSFILVVSLPRCPAAHNGDHRGPQLLPILVLVLPVVAGLAGAFGTTWLFFPRGVAPGVPAAKVSFLIRNIGVKSKLFGKTPTVDPYLLSRNFTPTSLILLEMGSFRPSGADWHESCSSLGSYFLPIN